MTTPALKTSTPTTKIFIKSTLNIDNNTALDLANFELNQRADGRAEETIQSRVKALKQIARLMNLNDPDTVKTWLSKLDETGKPLCRWNDKTKTKFCDTYTAYLNFKGLTWKAPTYKIQNKDYFIPTETEIDALVTGTGKTMSTVLLTLKETAIRIGELTLLKWTDLDTERRLLSITPEKGSNPRTLPISERLQQKILALSRQHSPNIFQPKKQMLREYYRIQRKRIATDQNNPRLLKITFHTFRHWKATTEYYRTLDVKHVQWMLGHRNSNSTDIYITLAKSIYQLGAKADEYTSKVTHSIEEETTLINSGEGWILHRAINETTCIYKKRK
jgi:integrase